MKGWTLCQKENTALDRHNKPHACLVILGHDSVHT